ncbi:hypothetical protein SAMN06265222_101389 [Neorhodopirellula lusitana]|uniref:Uncharacterized protein n=1 Tax=Neorhodopirellula lusitana TaxID=445327 RepID=A0ABY1PNT0_9BACT|nr:hypothetical protein [Neorhodopirellula lusitana]SMP39980.1 hypothetical protein SAMN06265222_101389 [Neorhodopirellula lusitana]
MSISLLFDICGLPLLVVLVLLSSLLSAFFGYLFWRVKIEELFVAFFPLNLLPVMTGVIASTFSLMSAVGMQVDATSELMIEPSFLLMMNLVPMMAGVLAAIPPALIAILGRAWLAWAASGQRLIPDRQHVLDEEVSDENLMRRDTEDYLDRLVRSR